LQVQKGDWVLGQKIDNPEVWQDIKSGKLQGFSIEAYLEPVLINNEIEMTKEEVDARIKEILMESEEEKLAAEAKLKEEEAAKLAMVDEPVPAPVEKTPEDLQKEIDALTTENVDLKAKLAEYELKEIEMSAEIIAAKKVAVEMGEELEKGIKPNLAPTKAYHEMTNAEKVRYNRNK